MKNFIRLRRVSWKSKNNVYLYKWNQIDTIMNDFWSQIDIIMMPKWYQISIEWIKIYEVGDTIKEEDIEMKENIEKIDDIEIWNYEAIAANNAIELSENYFWKNIIIFNPNK